ncbi:MAG: C4-dicarboxylate TRAP transporter substrate-binding protein [Rhodospirillaceae bacterium]|nr:C4-dicarboxylate TRAP transporter substrate-binding protein [Rhodospirillaceae bacterium]
MRSGIATMACVAALLTAASATAQEKLNLTIAAGQAPRALKPLQLVTSVFIPEVNRRIKEAGLKVEIQWKEAYAGSLLKPTRVLEGVKDGIAEIGFEPTIFHPDKLPLENITFVVPFVTNDVSLVSKVMNKMHATFPEYAAQYAKFGTVRLGGNSYDSYELISSFPVKKVEDVKGRKIGTAGAALAWIRGTGAVPVQSNMMEYYNSTKTGVFDAFIIFPSANPGMKYPEVAPYTVKVGFGAQYAAAMIINQGVLKKMSPQLQAIFRAAGEKWGAESDKAMQNAGEAGLKAVSSFKGQVLEFPREEQVKWAKMMPNIAKEWATKLDKQGLPGTKVLHAYMEEMRKLGAKPARDWDKE